jgi:hypothetical protein
MASKAAKIMAAAKRRNNGVMHLASASHQRRIVAWRLASALRYRAAARRASPRTLRASRSRSIGNIAAAARFARANAAWHGGKKKKKKKKR